MPKYMAVHVVVLAGLVLAVTFLVFQSRALTFRVQALEAAEKRESKAPAPTETSAKPMATPDDELKPTYYEGNPRYGLKEAPPPKAVASAEPEKVEALTPAQEQAVAKSVDRILKEKYGHLTNIPNPEDLEKTLEKELSLSESQKIRIGEILKWKRGEMNKVFQSDDGLLSGKSLKKAMDLENKTDELIKSELDATQQAKFDQLKKDGKISQGVTVQIDATDGPKKE